MKPSSIPQILARAVLALAALGAFSGSAQAGPAEDVREADSALATGDVFTAMSLLRRAADQKHPLAQARLGDLLHAAEFDQEALVYYRDSAAQGEAAGEFGLGRMYADGAGVPRDPVLALQWYRKAEAKNHAQTLDALARAYRTGDLGLAQDLDRANALDARVRSLQAAAKAAAK
jgi:TPR repeat protein